MKRLTLLVVLGGLLVALAPRLATADDGVRWQDIIGIIQAGNVVSGVTGGGQPWSTRGGEAVVNLQTGHIEFTVQGLVLAGGNSIGTPDAITQVKGTLVCAAASASPVLVDTPLVDLSAQGDARFSGFVTIPAVCETDPNIAFLIRIVAGRWIANGSVRAP